MAATNVVMLPPPVGHISEFSGGYTGTCGPTALSVAICAAQGVPVTEQYMVDLTHEMIANKEADANGATTIGELAWEAQHRGLQCTNYGYAEPFTVDWHTTLINLAGVKPIILELANGQALADVETGVGENATNLHYHYICVVGKQSDGYIVADGDNYQVLQRFQIYSYATIAAARPCAMLVIEMARTAAPTVSGVPSGWTDVNGTLRNPQNGNVVTLGFRDFIIANNWNPQNVPLDDDHAENGEEVQHYKYCTLAYNQTKGVYIKEDVYAIADRYRAAQASLQGQVTTLGSQITADAQEIADLQNKQTADLKALDALTTAKQADDQQITDLKRQLANVAPPDPRAEQAKAALDALIAYVKAS